MTLDTHPSQEAKWHSYLRRLRSAGSYDFCPWANRYVYWLKQPIGWFVVAAGASLLIGLTFAPQGIVMSAAIIAFILLGVLWPWIEMKGVVCRLRFVRSRAREGEPVRVRLEIVNRWPWSVRGLAVEGGFFAETDQQGSGVAVAFAWVPAWCESSYYWTFRPGRRGVYPVLTPRLTTGFPFGIWLARRDIDVSGNLVVWPQTIRLDSVPPVFGDDLTVAGILSRHGGNEGDVQGVRPYQQGDSLRKVHWPQTARHGRLIVCERQGTAHRTVRVTVDTSTGIHRGDEADGSLEWSIRIAATICRQLHAHNSRVECEIGNVVLTAEPGPTGIKALFDGLARYAPDPSNTPWRLRPKSAHAGLLHLLVTTDIGMQRLSQNRPIGAHRCVVLRSTGFERPQTEALELRQEPPALPDAWIRIDGPYHAADAFRKQWERICHDVWCAL